MGSFLHPQPRTSDRSFLLQQNDTFPSNRQQTACEQKQKTFLTCDGGDETRAVTSPERTSPAAAANDSIKPRTLAATSYQPASEPNHNRAPSLRVPLLAHTPSFAGLYSPTNFPVKTEYTTHRSPQDESPVAMDTRAARIAAAAPHLKHKIKSAASVHGNVDVDRPISEKLTALGVKVSEPLPAVRANSAWPNSGSTTPSIRDSLKKPASPRQTNGWASAQNAKSGDSKPAPHHKQPQQNNGWSSGWGTAQDSRKPDPQDWCDSGNGKARKGRNDRDRGQGHGPGSGAGKRSAWPTKEDFPKIDPKRWDIKWDDSPDNFSLDSARADNGWGDQGNADDTFGLAGWDGKLAPPPCEWDSRPAFRPNQSADAIYQWLSDTDQEMTGIEPKPQLNDLETANDITYVFIDHSKKPGKPDVDPKTKQMGDIVPRYWVPVVIGKRPPQTFWTELVRSTTPPPANEFDLNSVRPWWEQVVRSGNFLGELEHPRVTKVDPDETEDERLARENDEGSLKHAENRKNMELAKTQAKRNRQKNKEEKVKMLSIRPVSSTLAELAQARFAAGSKIFLRSARPDDMKEIVSIYNYYVENTSVVPETQRLTTRDMIQRYHDNVLIGKLPFLVAMERGDVIKGRFDKQKKTKHDDIRTPAKLVGFAYAEEYGDLQGMYRFTTAVHVYVAFDHCLQGIAKSLLDKLMALLDPQYVERGKYSIEGGELEEGCSPTRAIKKVIINFPYTNEERLAWVSKWLCNWMGFTEGGNLKEIGSKDGKAVNLAIFQYTTGATLDHNNLPATPTPLALS